MTEPPGLRIVEPEPGDPDPGALGIELIGLRLRAKSIARARELWCDLLAGSGRMIDGALEVRWPESPMRLMVRRSASGGDGGGEDAGGEEGPLAIEIACLRPAVVPVGPHPVLGAVFETVDITELLPPASVGDETSAGARESVPDAATDDDSYFLDPDALELEDRERS